jgi:sugar phosphate isomerase/epimerase
MRTLGIIMHAIEGLSDEMYVKTIAELGFSATFTGAEESDARQAELGELFAKNGIVYENLHAPFGHINDIWLDTEGGDAMLRELMTCVDRCVAGGAPIAVVHLSSGMTPPSITDIGRARWEVLVNYAVTKSVKIAFENQRMLANLAWAMEAFPDQGFCWDCGHEACFTPNREYMPLFGDRLICTHIHDNSGKFNADYHQLPFDGVFDYGRFADQIRKSGYTGSLMLEVTANPRFYPDITPDAYLRKAADVAKHLRTMVDGE